MANKNFEIVGENETASRISVKTIAIAFLAVALIAAVGISFIFKNRIPEDYATYEEKAKIYEDQGISYSYEDYEKDKTTIEKLSNGDSINYDLESVDGEIEIPEITLPISSDSMSEPTKQLLGKNDAILEEAAESTMVDTTANDVALSIIKQTKDMNAHISTHVGYPDGEWGEEYDGAKKFIDDVLNSMAGNGSFEPLYEMTVAQTQAELRYAISESIQYNVGNGYTQYNNILKNWMSMGHPIIETIETISLQAVDNVDFDGVYLNNMEAIIISNGTKYLVSLASQVVDGMDSYYKILDIRKI